MILKRKIGICANVKQKLIDRIHRDIRFRQLSKRKINTLLEQIIHIILTENKKGRSVKISGFGSFFTKKYQVKSVSHPISKQKINIPAQNKLKFIPSQKLKVL